MDSCPKELEPYFEAYKVKVKMRDEEMWLMGIYVHSAVQVAVEHCLAGRKAKSKYIEEPFLQKHEKDNQPLSKEELQRQRELFVAKLEVMKANFEINHNKDDSVS